MSQLIDTNSYPILAAPVPVAVVVATFVAAMVLVFFPCFHEFQELWVVGVPVVILVNVVVSAAAVHGVVVQTLLCLQCAEPL